MDRVVGRCCGCVVAVVVGLSAWLAAGSSAAPAAHGAGVSVWTVEQLGSADGSLSAVSCRSSRFCIAVGKVQIPRGDGSFTPRALAELWNGSRWSVLRTVDPAGSVETKLTGVSCSSRTACTAVGFSANRHEANISESQPLAERWNGLRWSVQGTAHVSLGAFTAVSCASRRICTAVGGTSNVTGTRGRALAERWNGSRCAIEPVPRLDRRSAIEEFEGVSCTSPRICTAAAIAADGFDDPEGVLLRFKRGVWTDS